MKVSINPHFENFSPPRRVIDGEAIYDVADLDTARGKFQLDFASDSIVNEDAAVLINTVELLDFLYRTSTTNHSECLLIDMSPCLYSQPIGQEILFSWHNPSRVKVSDEDILEICTLAGFRRALSEVEAAAASVFSCVSADLRDYLWGLARNR